MLGRGVASLQVWCFLDTGSFGIIETGVEWSMRRSLVGELEESDVQADQRDSSEQAVPSDEVTENKSNWVSLSTEESSISAHMARTSGTSLLTVLSPRMVGILEKWEPNSASQNKGVCLARGGGTPKWLREKSEQMERAWIILPVRDHAGGVLTVSESSRGRCGTTPSDLARDRWEESEWEKKE